MVPARPVAPGRGRQRRHHGAARPAVNLPNDINAPAARISYYKLFLKFMNHHKTIMHMNMVDIVFWRMCTNGCASRHTEQNIQVKMISQSRDRLVWGTGRRRSLTSSTQPRNMEWGCTDWQSNPIEEGEHASHQGGEKGRDTRHRCRSEGRQSSY